MRRFLELLLCLILLPVFVYGGQKITVEDFLTFKYPRQLAVGPEGSRFVYTVREADFQESKWRYQLWYLSEAHPAPRRLTFGNGNDYDPRWSPDGQWVAFRSTRTYLTEEGKEKSGIPQLWALPMKGGEAQQLTRLERGVDAYRWSDDGEFMAILSTEQKPPAVKEREERDEKLKFDETVKDSVKENKVFWILNFNTWELERLAVLDPGVDEFAISHNGEWIVYQTNYTGEYNDEQKYDLWALNTQSGEAQQITDFPGPETDPEFSPDDRRIAYINQTTPDVEFAETDLVMIPFRPGNRVKRADTLTRDLDRAVQEFKWEKEGDSFVIRTAEGTETHLHRFRYQSGDQRYTRLTPGGGNALDIHLGHNRIVYRWEDGDHLPEIAVNENGKQSLISDFSRQLDSFDLGTRKIFRWKSVDGQQIEGILFLPPDFDPKKTYPLILTVHGGPYGRFRQAVRQSHYKQIYSSDGYVVFAPNPRGSSGYSDDFGKAIWYKHGGHIGGIDYHDIMSGVNALIEDGFIDDERMGVIGGSYGGYLTNWIISQTDRFSAAVSQFGIFSLFTDWSNSWQPAWEKMYLGIYYWQRPIGPNHPYVKYSPAFYVANIHTPVLILHGEADKYTNLSNSQEMYQALKTLGREVKFVTYPREGHGIGREPNHRRDVAHRSKAWFDAHLKK